MTSPKISAPNVSAVNGPDKTNWPTVGGRMSPLDLLFVDRAVLEIRRRTGNTGYTRSEFIAEATIEKAAQVFGEDAQAIRDELAA